LQRTHTHADYAILCVTLCFSLSDLGCRVFSLNLELGVVRAPMFAEWVLDDTNHNVPEHLLSGRGYN